MPAGVFIEKIIARNISFFYDCTRRIDFDAILIGRACRIPEISLLKYQKAVAATYPQAFLPLRSLHQRNMQAANALSDLTPFSPDCINSFATLSPPKRTADGIAERGKVGAHQCAFISSGSSRVFPLSFNLKIMIEWRFHGMLFIKAHKKFRWFLFTVSFLLRIFYKRYRFQLGL